MYEPKFEDIPAILKEEESLDELCSQKQSEAGLVDSDDNDTEDDEKPLREKGHPGELEAPSF